MKQGIFTAEDFGFSPAANLTIEQVHREGVLTSASLAVGASAVAAGVMRARGPRRRGLRSRWSPCYCPRCAV